MELKFPPFLYRLVTSEQATITGRPGKAVENPSVQPGASAERFRAPAIPRVLGLGTTKGFVSVECFLGVIAMFLCFCTQN